MSASNSGQTAARQPKCARCRHHGIIVPQKGHLRHCPFVSCSCWKCSLVSQRTKLVALQRKMRKSQEELPFFDASVSEERPAVEGTPHGKGARQSATPGLMCAGSDGVPKESDLMKVPQQQFKRSDGKTYTELQAVREETPFASTENRSGPLGNRSYFSELGQREAYSAEIVALPALGLPLRVFSHYSSTYAPCPTILVNMPPMPPMPWPLKDAPSGSLVFPHFQSGAVHYPSPPEPGPPIDCRRLFLAPHLPMSPETYPDELMLRQQPQSPLPRTGSH